MAASLSGVVILLMNAIPALWASESDDAQNYERSGLFVSWHVPYPQARATDTLAVACNDTARVDTLYLSFALERSLPRVQSVSAVVYFHPLGGDTLGPFWFFKRGWANQGNMLIELHPEHAFPCEMPWKGMGSGAVSYDHRSGRGRLDLVYGVADTLAKTLVSYRDYCFGRVLIHHKKPGLGGCTQPVCIEWAEATVRYVGGREMKLSTGAYGVAGWNTGLGRGCRAKIERSSVKPWRPKAPGRTTNDSR